MSKKLVVGEYVALSISYGKSRLGDDYGVTKAKVMDVDPVVKKVSRPYGSKVIPAGTIRSESTSRFSSQYDDYVLDPEGKPMAGWVVVEHGGHFHLAKGELMRECVRKQKVLGTWKKHQEALKERSEYVEQSNALEARRRLWDEEAVAALQKAAPSLEVSELRPWGGSVTVDARDLLTLLGIDIKPRPTELSPSSSPSDESPPSEE